jgi:Fic family protein
MVDGSAQKPAGVVAKADAAYEPIPSFSAWADLTVDEEVWNSFVVTLDSERQSATRESLEKATEIALRSAAVDTGAIEGLYEVDRGFTYTVATQAAGWEVEFDQRGEDARQLFEAQLRGFEMVLDVATENMPVTEVWLRELHQVICTPQKTYVVETPQGRQKQTLPIGAYKTLPNHVMTGDGSVHSYAPVDLTNEEMHRLIHEVNSDDFAASHPVIQAAYAHYAFVRIHPFADGNGRVARALASIYLYRSKGVPLMIYSDQRPDYYRALEETDRGHPALFIDFILDRGLDSMADVSTNLRAARVGELNQVVQSLRNLHVGYGGLNHTELDAIGSRLHQRLLQSVANQLKEVAVPEGVSIHHLDSTGSAGRKEGFRSRVGNASHVQVTFTSKAPAQATVGLRFQVLVATDEDQRFAFVVTSSGEEVLHVRLSDAHPAIAQSFVRRLDNWLGPIFSQAVVTLRERGLESLRKVGYRR